MNNPIKLNPDGAFDFVITTAQDALAVLKFDPVIPLDWIGLTVRDRATDEEVLEIQLHDGIEPIQQFPGEYVLNFAHAITVLEAGIYDVDVWTISGGLKQPISEVGTFTVRKRVTIAPETVPPVYITTILGNPITVTVNGTEGLLTN